MFITSQMRITQDDYNKLQKCSKEEVEDFVAKVAMNSPFPPCGYGFSSPAFFKENNGYFVSWKRWSSCD